MSALTEFLEHLLYFVVEFGILGLEYVGVAIIIITGLRGLWSLVTKKEGVKLLLAEGFAMGLEFKLGGEILRTVVVQDFSEILIVAGIIVLRVSLTLLLHWEIKTEKAEKED